MSRFLFSSSGKTCSAMNAAISCGKQDHSQHHNKGPSTGRDDSNHPAPDPSIAWRVAAARSPVRAVQQITPRTTGRSVVKKKALAAPAPSAAAKPSGRRQQTDRGDRNSESRQAMPKMPVAPVSNTRSLREPRRRHDAPSQPEEGRFRLRPGLQAAAQGKTAFAWEDSPRNVSPN